MEILGLVSIPGWIAWIAMLLLSVFMYAWYKQTLFRRLGIPQKPVIPLFGDMFLTMKKGFGYIDVTMVEKHGKCFGTYLGCTPTLVISDTEMLKEIMVKQFSKFTDRALAVPIEKKWSSAVSIASGDHWKFMRQTLSPTFTTGKLKHVSDERLQDHWSSSLCYMFAPQMQSHIHKCLRSFTDSLEKKRQDQGDGFNIDPVLRGYTLDVIFTTAFGIEIDSQNNPDSPYVKYTQKLIDFDLFVNPLAIVAILFPELKPLVDKIPVPLIGQNIYEFFKSTVDAILNERQNDPMGHKDLLQLMLDAQKTTSEKKDDGMLNGEANRNTRELTYDEYKKRGLTDMDVLINSMVFMSAGFDTTATTLGWLMYDLSLHQDVQTKLIEEIDAEIGQEKATYDSAFKLEYLDMVLNETLRIHPVVTRLNREALEDVTICGVFIPKGIDCSVSPLALHFMSEHWNEPYKYDPERFSEANKSKINVYAYSPFGNGPRNCIGKRLALLEVKLTLIAVLQRYRILRSPKLKVPMTSTKIGLNRAAEPLYVQLEPRSTNY